MSKKRMKPILHRKSQRGAKAMEEWISMKRGGGEPPPHPRHRVEKKKRGRHTPRKTTPRTKKTLSPLPQSYTAEYTDPQTGETFRELITTQLAIPFKPINHQETSDKSESSGQNSGHATPMLVDTAIKRRRSTDEEGNNGMVTKRRTRTKSNGTNGRRER